MASSTSTTASALPAVAARRARPRDGVDELLALEAQGLVVADPRDVDVAEAHAHELAVGVSCLVACDTPLS